MMKGLKKSLVVKASAVVLTLILGFAIIGGISAASGDRNEPFLGDCIEYGIVCNVLNQTADMETNFIAGEYVNTSGQHTGNTVSDSKANAPGVIKVGEVKGELKLHSKAEVIQDPEVKKEAKDLIAKVEKYSKSVIDKSSMDLPEVTGENMNKYVIDAAADKDDVVYLQADEILSKVANGGIFLKMRDNQTIVFNIKEKDKVTIPRYKVSVTEGSLSNEDVARAVIWNMPYVANLSIESDCMHATVIAPKAGVNLPVTGEGWLVCDQLVSNGGEWHMISRSVPTPTPKATKKPTPTPEVTEEPTEEPTATPEITEEPTPTPEVTEAPTATPEVTEAPTATPEVTKKPTPKPTEKPTPKPTKKPTPKPTEKATPKPTEKPTPKPTEKPTPKPTETPAPTPEVTEAPTPAPTEVVETATPAPEATETPAPDVTTEEPTATPLVEVPEPPIPKGDASPEPSAEAEEETPTSTPELTTLDENEVPKTLKEDNKKAPKSKTTTILDEKVPLSDAAPETGDTTNLLFPVLAMGISVLAIVAVLFLRRKRS